MTDTTRTTGEQKALLAHQATTCRDMAKAPMSFNEKTALIRRARELEHQLFELSVSDDRGQDTLAAKGGDHGQISSGTV